MKRLAICLLMCFGEVNAFDLKPLPIIMSEIESSAAKNGKVDGTQIAYVFRRCSAIYNVMHSVAKENLNDKTMEDYYRKNGVLFATQSAILDMKVSEQRKGKSSLEDSAKNSSEVVRRLIEIYTEDVKANQIRSGNYFSDKFRDDTLLCNELVKFLPSD